MSIGEFVLKSNVLDAALSWLAGGVAVVPVRLGSKVAAVRWHRWQDELPSEELVRQWFGNRTRNLGLVCGSVSGGLIVLDFDDRVTYEHWCELYPRVAGTHSVATSRGMHVYLRVPHAPGRTFSLPSLDVKCSGYVLAPPSIHPTGRVYETVQPAAPIKTLPALPLAGLFPERTTCERAPTARLSIGGEHELRSGGADAVGTQAKDGPDARRPPTHTQPRRSRTTGAVRLYRGVARDIKRALSVLELAERHTIMKCADDVGLWYLGRCPDPQHADHHPSFRIDSKRNYATCLTPTCRLHCPRGLSVIDLYARLHNLTAKRAMLALAVELGLVR